MKNQSRRQFLTAVAKGSTAAAAIAAAPHWARAQQPATAKPLNFILILADDLGAKELGCYGNKVHKTPVLDGLAAGGAMFKTAYVTPLCSPTRIELMSGQYGFRTKWLSLIGRAGAPTPDMPEYDIGKNIVTFAEVVKPKGYVTAMAGKWQLPGEHPNLIRECGFDEYCMWAYAHNIPGGAKHQGGFEDRNQQKPARYWNPCIVQNGQYRPTKPDDYGPDVHTDFLIDFIRRNKDKPFLAYHSSCLTHGPHLPTPDTRRRNPAAPMANAAENFKDDVEYLDKITGRLVQALDELGLRNNTVIIFIGDNGTGGDGKGQVSELGARVPLIINCPGVVKAGLVSDELVDGTDILPTIAEFAGAPLPQGVQLDGLSIARHLRGEPQPTREWIFSYLRDKRMLRDKRWLLEGDGKFFDCGDSRDGTGYKDVTASQDPEVLAARKRFDQILEKLPAPDRLPGQVPLEEKAKGGKGKGKKKQQAPPDEGDEE